MIIDQLTPTVSDNLTDEVPVEQGTSTFKTTWQKILNLFKGNITASDIASTGGDVQDDIDDLQGDVSDLQTDKQDTLVSGTNIKTIGNSSLLGSGDIAFPVTSVNSKTGAVVLDPDDVGAMSKQQDISTGITALYAVRTGKMVTLFTSGNGFPITTSGVQLPSSLFPTNQLKIYIPCYTSDWSHCRLEIGADGKLFTWTGTNKISVNYASFSVTYELANP